MVKLKCDAPIALPLSLPWAESVVLGFTFVHFVKNNGSKCVLKHQLWEGWEGREGFWNPLAGSHLKFYLETAFQLLFFSHSSHLKFYLETAFQQPFFFSKKLQL